MPIVRNVTGGAQVIASAKIARRFTVTVAPGSNSTLFDGQLQVNTQPNCFWYALLTTAGVAGVTFTPQFAVDNASNIPQYFNVIPPQVLFANVPFFSLHRIVANMITGIITVPAGAGAPATVQIILASSI